ncbi:MAG TPA: ABC transporter C-terminal domain-containing protein, partial [Mycobacterium sp.]|nr:ABC transporter C-terminal domain-containing protein [Mycobacterium sp.]
DGRLRHLPGGVDEYLKLASQTLASASPAPATSTAAPQAISGSELRAAEKEIAAIDRRLARLADQIAAKHHELAEHDQSDHVGITRLTQELRELEGDVAGLETRWLELSEVVERA